MVVTGETNEDLEYTCYDKQFGKFIDNTASKKQKKVVCYRYTVAKLERGYWWIHVLWTGDGIWSFDTIMVTLKFFVTKMNGIDYGSKTNIQRLKSCLTFFQLLFREKKKIILERWYYT